MDQLSARLLGVSTSSPANVVPTTMGKFQRVVARGH